MKPTSLLKAVPILSFLNANLAFGQDKIATELVNTPFAKGNIYMSMSNDLMFSWKNLKTNDESAGNRNRFGLHYEGTYFFTDHVGVGIGISSGRTKEKNGDAENIESYTIGSVHAMYGQSLGGIYNIYGKASVRAGMDKSAYDYPGYSQENKYKESGLNFEVGTPLALGKGTGFLVTPYLNYDYGVSKNDDYKDVSSGIFLGTRLNYSFPCAAYAHGCSQVKEFSENMYTKGTNVIGGSGIFALNLGTLNSQYIGDDMYEEYDYKLSEMCFETELEYYYYLFNNVALGVEARLRASGEKDKESDYRQNSLSWMVKPKIQANLPFSGELHNTFGFIGYGYGTSKDKSTNENNNETETKYSNTELSIGAGYSLFFARKFALVPEVYYSAYTRKNTDTDVKNQRNGPGVSFSIRHSF